MIFNSRTKICHCGYVLKFITYSYLSFLYDDHVCVLRYLGTHSYLCVINVCFHWVFCTKLLSCIISSFSIIFPLALCMDWQCNGNYQNRSFIGLVHDLKTDIHFITFFFLLLTFLCERLLKLLLLWFVLSLIFTVYLPLG